MNITIPKEFKDSFWDRKLYLIRKSKDSFIVLTEKDRDSLKKKLSELNKNPDNVAFNRFILSGIIETKSIDGLLELPALFEDFSNGNISFSIEGNSTLVSKV